MVLNISFFWHLCLAEKSTCQNLQSRKQYSCEQLSLSCMGKAVSVGKIKAGTQQVVDFNQGFPEDSWVGLDSHLPRVSDFLSLKLMLVLHTVL